jgi:hypothetical protein
MDASHFLKLHLMNSYAELSCLTKMHLPGNKNAPIGCGIKELGGVGGVSSWEEKFIKGHMAMARGVPSCGVCQVEGLLLELECQCCILPVCLKCCIDRLDASVSESFFSNLQLCVPVFILLGITACCHFLSVSPCGRQEIVILSLLNGTNVLQNTHWNLDRLLKLSVSASHLSPSYDVDNNE